MNGGRSGFYNAPVSRALLISSAIFTIFFGRKGRSNHLAISLQDVFQKPQLWKFIVSMFAFTSTPELLFGLYLLYYFRVFERHIGSNKYSVFILFSVAVSFMLQSIAFTFLEDRSALITSGPYSLIFASFVSFYLDIPASTRFRVSGVQLSDKSFIYLVGLQMLLSSRKRSIIPGICGILAGSLYRMNIFRIRRAKVPHFIPSLFTWLSWSSTTRSSQSSAPRGRTTHVSGNAPSYAGRQVQRRVRSVEPAEESVGMLVSMGFERDSAREALMQAGNDINVATNILLESQTH